LAKKMKTNEEPAAPTSTSSSIFDLTGDSDIEMQDLSESTDSKKVVEPPNVTTWGQLFAKPAPTDSVPSFVIGSSGNVAPLFAGKQRTETLLPPPSATSLVSLKPNPIFPIRSDLILTAIDVFSPFLFPGIISQARAG
jgi:hypothetical protein